MRVWKTIPLLLSVLVISACANKGEESTASADASAPATANPPALAAPTAAAPKTATASPTPRNDAPAKPVDRTVAVTIPAGTELTVILSNSLNSGRSQAGDEFEGGLAAPVSVNGQTILNRGTKIVGKVIDAEGSGRVKGRASMRLALTSVSYNGKMVSVATNPFVSEAEATKGRDAAVVGGGAGLGAAIGAIAGGKKGAATGAVIGGAAGGGTVLATKGKEVDFPAESKITFTLSDDLTVRR